MESDKTEQFKLALKKPPDHRNERDLELIFSFLHGVEGLPCKRESALRAISQVARYQCHNANDILYCRGEIATCWYILLTGCVFIEGHMFLPRSCFGQRTERCSRRPNECLMLEPSEMMVIDNEINGVGANRRSQAVNHGPSIERYLGETDDAKIEALASTRYPPPHSHSDPTLPAELQSVQSFIHRNDTFLRGQAIRKRNSRASDTSSAYSGSDVMQSLSVEDGDIDASSNTFTDNMCDSDDEDVSDGESMGPRDTVRECLERDPTERSDDDIEILLDFMQNLPAFANMTLATRRELCAVMVYAVVDEAGIVVMRDGEELDSWSVLLNGQVRVTRPDGTVQHYNMGDSFGITPTMEKMYHQGVMETMVDDCQFVCIAQEGYYRILHQGEQNTVRLEEEGKVVLVTERRSLDSGNRKGVIVIKGTPEKLMGHLVEEDSAVDATYVEDFLLTYRTFLPSPVAVTEKLSHWFTEVRLRDKVTRVVLLWVNNHFSDFENDQSMSDFLDEFEAQLGAQKMGGQQRLLNIACAAKARPRNIVYSRKEKPTLHFTIFGGAEHNSGIFISKVERGSPAHQAGLKRGDQILEVNNYNFEQMHHKQALEILRSTTTLSITVKSNWLAFKEVNNPAAGAVLGRRDVTDLRGGVWAESTELSVLPVIAPPRDKGGGKEKPLSTSKQNKIRKALSKFSINPSKSSASEGSSQDDSSSRYGRQVSQSSGSSRTSLTQSHSSQDIVSMESLYEEFPEYVVKVFRADQTFKYVLITRGFTAQEIVMLALQEFGIKECSSSFSLYEVTIESRELVKTKRLPDQLANLPGRMTLHTRYYIKNNRCSEPLVPDDSVPDLVKECQVNILQLNPSEVAAQLTLRDFNLFHNIEPTEYVDDLFHLGSSYGHPNLEKFSLLVNKEMFWVVTEVTQETNIVKRMKLLKHFIKIARHCKDMKNFNSLFAIVSGLGHGSVSRLKATWDRLPAKYNRLFEDLQDLMDPSRNMSKYRNLVNSDKVQPPSIPFFPVVKKDLTFIHLGNDSRVDGLINFEKLRMVAKAVRHTYNMASTQYDLSQMYLSDSQSVLSAFSGSANATTLRKARRQSSLFSAKKIFDEAQMVRRVQAYLQNLVIEEDEARLNQFSLLCEPAAATLGKKRDPSPGPAALERTTHLGPKFGAKSPEAVRKLMSLSDKVRTHNVKSSKAPSKAAAMFASRSPLVGHRPPSPRLVRPSAVTLSAEDSSVFSSHVPKRGPALNNSCKASESSSSPTNSVGSSAGQQESDSGHNSLTSSTCDAYSACSNSPPARRKVTASPHVYVWHPPRDQQQLPQRHHQPQRAGDRLLPPPSTSRPPPPPYHVVIQNHAVHSQFLKHQYNALRASGDGPHQRPVLPDYVTATSRHRKQQAPMPPSSPRAPPPIAHVRTRSLDSFMPSASDNQPPRLQRPARSTGEEGEQVSAV